MLPSSIAKLVYLLLWLSKSDKNSNCELGKTRNFWLTNRPNVSVVISVILGLYLLDMGSYQKQRYFPIILQINKENRNQNVKGCFNGIYSIPVQLYLFMAVVYTIIAVQWAIYTCFVYGVTYAKFALYWVYWLIAERPVSRPFLKVFKG